MRLGCRPWSLPCSEPITDGGGSASCLPQTQPGEQAWPWVLTTHSPWFCHQTKCTAVLLGNSSQQLSEVLFFFFKEIIYTGSLIFLSTSKNEAPIRQRPEGVCQIWSTEGGPLATARLECFNSGTLITTSGPKSLSSHRNASKACACFWKLYSHFTYSQNLTRAHCRIMQEICKFHQGVILCFFTHYCIMPRQNTNVCTVLK